MSSEANIEKSTNETRADNIDPGVFVSRVIANVCNSTQARVSLRRADSANQVHYAWPYLIQYGVNIEHPASSAYAVIAAAIARDQPQSNSSASLGAALAYAHVTKQGEEAPNPAIARLRRLLACEDRDELCRILPNMLATIRGKAKQNERPVPGLNYVELLNQVLAFDNNPGWFRRRNARSFYQIAPAPSAD